MAKHARSSIRQRVQGALHAIFSSPLNALLSVIVLWGLANGIAPLFDWAYAKAVFTPDPVACQSARGLGACWGVIVAKYPLILWGRYPYEQQWREQLASLVLIALIWHTALFRPPIKRLATEWCASLLGVFVLLSGQLGPLEPLRNTLLNAVLPAPFTAVPTDLWGGLPLTLMLSVVCTALAMPLGVTLALGRTCSISVLSAVCTAYIELVRGVPLISVLFMASYMFPLLMPSGYSPDVLLRVTAGITLFAAAYLAEIVRAGLQAVPAAQTHVSLALGLNYWQTQRLITLPQALKIVIPSLMNSFIAIFKDTSLITVVSLYELTGSLALAMNGDADWRAFKLEGYLFITAIYFVFCYAMSRFSLSLEQQLKHT